MEKKQRDKQQDREIKENQEALRRSIEETSRLVGESEEMLKRHRAEREEDQNEN